MSSSSDVRTGTGPDVAPGSGQSLVVATDLEVGYGKRHRVRGLRGFTATFRPGITGLVGPNGAGKTTLLRTLAGGMEPRGGRLEMQGQSPAGFRSTHGIGFLPESPPLPDHLTGEEFLRGLGEIPFRGGGEEVADAPCRPRPGRFSPGLPLAEVRPLISRDLLPEDFLPRELLLRPLGSLSMGQRKKMALAAALMGNPRVLLLDEPTNGLDPLAVRDLRRVLLAEKAHGRVILISSHHLDELQRISDEVVFIRDGRAAGTWSREEAADSSGSLESLFESHFAGSPT